MSIAQELQQEEQEQQEESKGKRKGKRMPNKYMKNVALSMYYNCYVDEKTKEPDDFFNRGFIIEKISREFLQPLTTGGGDLEALTKEQFMDLVNEAWDWHQDTSIRVKKEQLMKLLEPFKDDPDVLATFQKSIQALGLETNNNEDGKSNVEKSIERNLNSNTTKKVVIVPVQDNVEDSPQGYGTDDDYELIDVPM